MKRVRVPLSYPAPDDFDGASGSLPGWQLCRGISGSFRVEWVAGFVWNQWQPWSGIRNHALGRLSDAEKRFVPKEEHGSVYREARIMLGIYALIFAGMAVTGWWGLIWYWLIPLFLGEPVMRFIRMTEHVGRPTVAKMTENTRTNLVSAPWRFLCWNMNYHAEHHYVPLVPYHTLPRLHEKLRDHIHIEPGGYLGAHRDILRKIHEARA